MDNKVTNEHPMFAASTDVRTIFEDVCAGTETVRKQGEKYLPKFPAEHAEDWKYRNNTATLLNVTKKTVDTLCGLVFQKDITFSEDVPTEIQGTETATGLIENIDNKGNHFNVFARDLFEDSFDGWAGILVDAPTVTANDLGEQRKLGIRPYWVAYDACDIINWDYEIDPVSKKMVLSLVVLRECLTVRTAQFKREERTQYRVLMLNDSRMPVWELWTEKQADNKDGKKEYVLTDQGTFGKQTKIPFAVVGELGDKPPLMDLTFKNIEHYQGHSDYKSIIHKTCVPMLWTAGLDGDAPNNIGGSSWWKLTENGQMGFAEVSGNSIEKTRQYLEDIKGEMALLGLQMLMSDRRASADVTATEKLLDSIQETSSLQVRATQLKDALELALGFTAQYLGKGEDAGGSITLGCTWAQLVVSAQELTALSALVDAGQLSLESFLWYLEKTDKLPDDVDVKEEMDRIDKEMKDNIGVKPVMNALNNPNGNPATGQPAPPAAAQAA